jgi:murein DD-endopeptidase MepM/ murein hydrolase activator NlpD
LASEEERQLRSKSKKSPRRVAPPLKDHAVGRYDENRVNLYKSNLFDDESNAIDGFAGARTLHIGIDLDGPIGTKVHAFTNGIVHSAGYNADLGDYGNVIVIEHDLGNGYNGEPRKVYALYGHLDNKSIKGIKEGRKIKKGQVIGRFGDIHENGGW